MKNNKGITLTSLVIYITLIFVIIGIVMRITTHFRNSMVDVADTTFQTEFNKINMYLLEESKKTNNEIIEIIDGTQISFTNGNKYTYNSTDKNIYLNNTIKICENVESCLFEEKIAQNGKRVIVFTIEIEDTIKTTEYVISYSQTEQIINELDYTWGNTTNIATE